MIDRTMSETALQMAGWFPIVSITGPRQSGKSTLVKAIFPEYEYVNLEDIDVRELAAADPVGFIRNRPGHLIIDEAQLVPELFSTLQVVSDEVGKPGQYILSGSQNFLLLKQISQSLAGRVGLLKLLPLSFKETSAADSGITPSQYEFQGGYPRIYDVGIPPRAYYDGYLSAYVEHDVSGYLGVRNAGEFQTFVRLLAQAAGSLLNITRLSNDVGVSSKTIRSWLSILESSYIVFQLPPYHANVRKRLIKTPKIYFYDTGLLCHLLNIHNEADLIRSGFEGPVFENLIIGETMKRHLNKGINPELYFYRDVAGEEVDLIDLTDEAEVVEIKSSMTFRSSFVKNVEDVSKLIDADEASSYVVMQREDDVKVRDVQVVSAESWLKR